MRQLVYRFAEPLLARIPDYSAEPPKRQAAIGLAASFVVHVLFFLFLVVGVWLTPNTPGYQNVQEEAPLEIEIVPPKEKTEPETQQLTLDEKRQREVLLSRGLKASEEKPKDADFESDQNMVAGSESPATGLLPLPSQEGRTDLPGNAFTEQDVIIGATEDAAASILRGPKGDVPPPPLYKPKPLTQAQIDAANEASATDALPKVSTTTSKPPVTDRLRETPAPSRNVPKAGEGEMVFAARKPATPAPNAKAVPSKEHEMVDAPLTRPPMAQGVKNTTDSNSPPSPQSNPTPKFREHLEKNRIEGRISNRGRSGVNAEGTPMGIYQRNMTSLIGSRWNFYVKERSEFLAVGAVRVRWMITSDGKIEDVVVEANDANRALADVCIQAIRETKLPPLPEDVAATLNGGRYEMVVTFSFLSPF